MNPIEAPTRWKILDTRHTCVALVEWNRGLEPDPSALLVPVPALGLARGDIILFGIGLRRVLEGDHVRLDTKEELYALREAFGGRGWVVDAVPRLTADTPDPVRIGRPEASEEYERSEYWRLGEYLRDARRWGNARTVRLRASVTVLRVGRVGRVSAPVDAADDEAAIESLLAAV